MQYDRPPLVMAFLAASVISYLICLPHGAICIGGSCGGWSGFSVALFGWAELLGLGSASTLVVMSWFANPAVWIAWTLLLVQGYLGAAAAGLVGMLLALGYGPGSKILLSESGTADLITAVGPGYWAWVLSMVLACAAGLIGWLRADSDSTPPAHRW